MSIEVSCDCGRQLRVRDEYAGHQVQCPDCEIVLTVPGSPVDPTPVETNPEPRGAAKPETPPPPPVQAPPISAGGTAAVVSQLSGRPAARLAGSWCPWMLGTAVLTLTNDRVVEETRHPISSRHAELLLERIESAEIVKIGHPLLLLLGVALLPAQGIGLIPLALYFVIRFRLLAVRSGANIVAVRIKTNDDAPRAFLNAVLAAAGTDESR